MDEQNTRVGGAVQSDDRTVEIRAEIDRTREDLSETVDAIQDRLRPSSIASSAAQRVKEATTDRVHELAESDTAYYVEENRWPIAMVGVGLAGAVWLMSRGDGRSSRPARRSVRRERWDAPASRRPAAEPGLPAPERNLGGHDYADYSSREDFGDYSGGREYGNYSAGRPVRQRQPSSRSYQRDTRPNYVQRAWQSSPLLVGAAAAALGAIVGLGVPETERENELMGEARDNMMAGISETVRAKVDEVQHVASDAIGTMENAAKQVAGPTGDEPRGPGSSRSI